MPVGDTTAEIRTGNQADLGAVAPARRSLAVWILIAFVLLGTGLRLRQYLARTSFFSDEASLILNFRTHTAGQLLGHLDYGQAAPPVFLWIGRAMYARFGPNEYALRFYPLIGGVLSLALFALLAWRTLPPWPAALAVAFFALCEKLITYCGELKQYSTDVLAVVVLMLVALVWSQRQRPAKRVLRLSVVAALLLWASHPTIILFAALGSMLLWECLRRGWREFELGVASCLPVVASFGAVYLISIRRQHEPYLFEFWANAFPDWSQPLSFPGWLLRQTYELINTPYVGLGVLLLGLIGAGLAFAWKRKRLEMAVACLLPLVLTALASCIRQYPFNGSRLTMFLFPGLLLMTAMGAAAWVAWLPRNWSQAGLLAGVPIIVLGLIQGTDHAIHPRYISHIRPVVAYVRQHFEPGDAIYLLGEMGPPEGPLVKTGWHHEFLAYWPDPPAVVHTQLRSVHDIHEKRFWVAFAFRPHIKGTLRLFDRVSEVADMVGKPFVVKEGGAACLFELREPHPSAATNPTDPHL